MTDFVQLTVCPFCRAHHDRSKSVGHSNAPEDGAISLCVNCGEWSFFEAAAPGHLRKPTDAEYIEIAASPLLRRTREAWVNTVGRAATKQ